MMRPSVYTESLGWDPFLKKKWIIWVGSAKISLRKAKPSTFAWCLNYFLHARLHIWSELVWGENAGRNGVHQKTWKWAAYNFPYLLWLCLKITPPPCWPFSNCCAPVQWRSIHFLLASKTWWAPVSDQKQQLYTVTFLKIYKKVYSCANVSKSKCGKNN